MLKIEGKTFMNIQEAVQWLLDNNALPFQSTANYAGNTEIGLGTIVNPSPAKVRIGSLIFFADSKVSTVTGLTENGFICSDEYNNLVDDIAYVTGVSINASGHLITTLSDGQTIDAGLVKQVASFGINSSQHLTVTYNDGTAQDLGAIFNGNVTISGDLTVTGAATFNLQANFPNGLSAGSVSSPSIIETMTGYSWTIDTSEIAWTPVYVGAVKTGNKLTFVVFGSYERQAGDPNNPTIGRFTIPDGVGSKLYPFTLGLATNMLACSKLLMMKGINDFVEVESDFTKNSNTSISVNMRGLGALTANVTYLFRMEYTFLLSDSLAS